MIHILDGQTDALLAFLDGQGDGIYIQDEIEQDINGLSTLTFTSLSGSDAAAHLRDLNRVLVPHERHGWQEYVIYETLIDGDFITVYCIGSETQLNTRKLIDPAKHNGFTLKQYVTLATSGTEWQVGNVEFAGTHTLTFTEYMLPYDFLKSAERAFDMELSFRIEVAGSQVTGRYVDVFEKIGSGYVGKEFVNAKDLIGVQKKIHNDRIITALEAVGPKPKDGSKPLRIFVSDEDAFQRWNHLGLHVIDEYTPESDDEDMTIAELESYARAALKKRIDSVVEYSITVVDLSAILGHEATYLGDTVRIKDTDFNPPLYAEARIINVKRPVPNDEAELVEKTYTIGEVVEYAEDDVLAKFREMQAAYGLRVVKSPTPPVGNVNIIWIKTDPNSAFEVSYSWDGTNWVPMTAETPAALGAETPGGARSKAIETYINVIETEKAQTAGKYDSIYLNPDLKAGTVKTALATAKANYDAGFDSLLAEINAAKADGSTSLTEKASVDQAYAAYSQKVALMAEAMEDATREIEEEKMLRSRFFTWIKYADSPTSGMSDTPTGKTYLGIAYNKESASESSVYSDYSWSLIVGAKGDEGIPGPTGPGGESLYTWIKYADTALGGGISDSPTGKKYLGVAYNKESITETSTPSDYSWSLIQGPQGVQGPIGPDGITTYSWIKYADTPTTGMSETPTGKKYMGIATNKLDPNESSNYADYSWSLIVGEKGDTGIPGDPGADGAPTYIWVKYADTPTTGMNDSPTGKKYLGLAYNKSTATESSSYSDYSWSKIEGPQGIQGPQGDVGPQGLQGIQGADGTQGIKGDTGANGLTSYTHIAYANNVTGTSGFSTSDPTNKTYIGMYTDFVAADSTNPALYNWSLIKGADGAQGIAGPTGPNGQTSYLHIAYATSSNGATGFSTTVSAGKTYIGQYTDFTAADSTNYADYSWTLIKGEKGISGEVLTHLKFNGIDEYISFPAAANTLVHGSTTASIEMWVKKNDLNYGLFQLSGFAQTNGNIYPYTDPTMVYLDTFKTARFGPITMHTDVRLWHHLAITTEPGTNGWKLYQNGELVYQAIGEATVSTNYLNFEIGRNSGNRYANAQFRDVRLWNVVRTQSQIVADMNKILSGSEAGLVGLWKLDDGGGSVALDSAGTNHGTINGGTWVGPTMYTWIKYADTPTTGMSDDATGKHYMGVSYNNTTPTESSDYSDYQWMLVKGDTGATGLQGIQGPTGSTGIQGPTGANGLTAYTHIAYSTSATGSTGFSTSNPAGATYIGMYTDHTAADSNTPSMYNWSLIKGADGSQGIQGPTGPTGQTSYLHIAYATSSNGATGFSTTVSTGKTYIGQYTDFTAADSTNYADYSWTLIKGDKGDIGSPGFALSWNTTGTVTVDSQANLSKTSGGISWDSQAYSTEKYTGGAFLSFKVGQTDMNIMFGLNSDPATDSSYTSLDYAFYVRTTATFACYENGVSVGTAIAYAVGDVFSIVYDNVSINYYHNGTLFRTVATTSGRTFAVDSSFSTVSANTPQIYDIYYGPSASKGDTGNTGPQGPEGQLNLVNNPHVSGNVTGWNAGIYSTTTFTEGESIGVLDLTTAGSLQSTHNQFVIEPQKMYEYSVWIKDFQATGNAYVGMHVHGKTGANIGAYPVYSSTGGKSVITTNGYFWSGNKIAGVWRRFVGYLIPAGFDLTDTNFGKGLGTNVATNFQLPGDATKATMRFLNYYNSETTTMKIAHPMVKEVDISVLHANKAANEAVAAKAAADKAIADSFAAQGTADGAQSTANGKNTVFYQTSAPTTVGRTTGDIWFDTDDGNKMYGYNGGWVLEQFGTNAIEALAIKDAHIEVGTISSAKIANLDAGKITTGVMSADRISATTLSAIVANLGTVTAGIFRNATGTNIIDMTAGTINLGNGNFTVSGSTVTFKGALSGATGTFAGSLSAATGTFKGALSAATGTFSGTLSGADGTFSGTLNAASGTFKGDMVASVIKLYSDGTNPKYGVEMQWRYHNGSTFFDLGNIYFRPTAKGLRLMGGNDVSPSLTFGLDVHGSVESYDMLTGKIYTDNIQANLNSTVNIQNKTVVSANDDALVLAYPSGDNAFISYDEAGVRQAYVGFPGNGSNVFAIDNKRTSGSTIISGVGYSFKFYSSPDGWATIHGNGYGQIKFLTTNRIQFRDAPDVAYSTIYSAGHTTISQREMKKNIVTYEGDALYEIMTTPIREYHYNDDLEWEQKRIGVIVDESPLAALDLTGAGVSEYAMVTLAWRAIQQLTEQAKVMNDRIKELEAR